MFNKNRRKGWGRLIVLGIVVMLMLPFLEHLRRRILLVGTWQISAQGFENAVVIYESNGHFQTQELVTEVKVLKGKTNLVLIGTYQLTGLFSLTEKWMRDYHQIRFDTRFGDPVKGLSYELEKGREPEGIDMPIINYRVIESMNWNGTRMRTRTKNLYGDDWLPSQTWTKMK